METKRFTFSDLNSFVNGRISDLHDHEITFHNQLIGLTEMLKINTFNRIKLELLCNHHNNVKLAQDTLGYTLDSVQNNLNQWERLLFSFTQKYESDLNQASVDGARATTYQKAENLFVDLTNCHDLIEEVESKAKNYNNAKNQDSFYALFDVMNNNLILLEKLALHIQKLKTRLNFNEHIRDQIVKKCFCHQQFY